MARLIDFGGEVNSNLVSGLGTNSVVFTMPGNIGLAVESVLATINNGAGGDTTAKLTIRDQSGEVIAKKAQGAVIPAADTGTATWALRLADDSTYTPPGGTNSFEAWFQVLTVNTLSSAHVTFFGNIDHSGDLFDLGAGAFLPRARHSGIYGWTVTTFPTAKAAGKFGRVVLSVDLAGGSTPSTYQMDSAQDFPLDGVIANNPQAAIGTTRYLAAGQNFDVAILNGAGVNLNFAVIVVAQRIT